jgi:hypothetical protein
VAALLRAMAAQSEAFAVPMLAALMRLAEAVQK